jgi:glycosyltransferase involved in cell wall biosynthesis
MNSEIRLSVIVPLFNERENVPHLVRAVREVLGEGEDWELLLVDDGSTDGTRRVAEEAGRADERVRLLPLARNYGQTAAMQAGFDHSRGQAVVSMDGDLQNDPADIPALVAKLDEGYDLVAGYRVRRQDRLLTRKLPSWAANRVIGWVTGVPIRDNGCSLKAYRRELLERMHLYSDMHRFIPAMAVATAGARVTELPVRHHARRFGESKYGLSRIWKVTSDLITLRMLSGFRERPLAMFGVGAFGASLLSLLFIVLTTIGLAGVDPGPAGGDFVFPSVALVFLSLAFFLLLLGLVGEVAISGARENDELHLPVAVENSRW